MQMNEEKDKIQYYYQEKIKYNIIIKKRWMYKNDAYLGYCTVPPTPYRNIPINHPVRQRGKMNHEESLGLANSSLSCNYIQMKSIL